MDQLHSDIFDAAIVPELWTEMLDRLVGETGARTGLLLSSHLDPAQVYSASSLSTSLLIDGGGPVIEYEAEYKQYEHAARQVILRAPQFELVSDIDIWPDRAEFDARPDVVFLRRHFGIHRRIAARLNDHPAWYDVLSVQFDADITELSDALTGPFRRYLPFVSRASELSKSFHILKARFRAVLAALGRYKVPVLLVSPAGHVVLENSSAALILSKADGLTRGQGRLIQIASPDQRAQLVEMIARAAETARGEGASPGGGMVVTRPSGRDPYYVEVSPLRDTEAEVDSGFRAAMLTIYDPDYAPLLDLRGFAAVHQLTDAEKEVAEMIVDGTETAEIAERRGTALETTRNQVKSILRKTRCRNRTELVRRAVTSTVPVEREPNDPKAEDGTGSRAGPR